MYVLPLDARKNIFITWTPNILENCYLVFISVGWVLIFFQ
jgi:hypothetical protein